MSKPFYKSSPQSTERRLSLRPKGGFTLLEIMVALAVLSISLVVLLGLRNRDIALSERARRITEATFLGRQKMTAISISGFPDFGETHGDFEEEGPYTWRQEVKQTPFDEVREVLVQVVWKNNSSEESVRFTSYIFDDASGGRGNAAQ